MTALTEVHDTFTFRHNDGTEEHFDTEEELNAAFEKFNKKKKIENFKKHWVKFSLYYILTFIAIFLIQCFLIPIHIVFCIVKDIWFTVKNLHEPDELIRNMSNHRNL